MIEAENIDRVVAALQTVQAKRLRIIELANDIKIVDGMFDQEALAALQLEINLAIAEAKNYGAHTLSAVSALSELREVNTVDEAVDEEE